MALLANTKNTIERTGRNIPIPFSETVVSPDKFRDRYTKNPSKKKFNMIFSCPKTNCDFRFLNINTEANDKMPDNTNNPSTKKLSLAKTTVSSTVVQILNTNINPQDTIAERNK